LQGLFSAKITADEKFIMTNNNTAFLFLGIPVDEICKTSVKEESKSNHFFLVMHGACTIKHFTP
jgi:hypothetical protein